jgi:hypothetical protein
MIELASCPECRSEELVETTRKTPLYGELHAVICRACHWSSDPRIGRPPADRSKNVGLRRLLPHDDDQV